MTMLVPYWRLFPLAAIITAAIFFLGAVQLLCLGILGEYLGRVYEEVKGQPLFTLKEVAGIGTSPGFAGGPAMPRAGNAEAFNS